MADGRHFENRYTAISQRKSLDFDEILYTAADFELDERHVIKNEKVALDRLRVRQNVFLVCDKYTGGKQVANSALRDVHTELSVTARHDCASKRNVSFS